MQKQKNMKNIGIVLLALFLITGIAVACLVIFRPAEPVELFININFDYGSGSGLTEKEYTVGETVSLPSETEVLAVRVDVDEDYNPDEDNQIFESQMKKLFYRLVGWSTKAEGEGNIYLFSNADKKYTVPEEETTLYAIWETSPVNFIPIKNESEEVTAYEVIGNRLSIDRFNGAYGITETKVKNLVIPDSYLGKPITRITDHAFVAMSLGQMTYSIAITSVVIPEGILSIGDRAFYRCRIISSINFPAGLETIGELAFYECVALRSINFPAGLKTINSRAFLDCRTISDIEFPAGLESIEEYAFYGCKSLVSVNLPESLGFIGDSAFLVCESLASINLPEKLTTIEPGTFGNCKKLTGIELPAGLESIGRFAFYNSTALANINLPAGLKSIGDSAFLNCTSITSIELPAGLESIEIYAFAGWISDQTIFVLGFASEAEADAAWGIDWQKGCNAEIIYLG